ncbi:ABC transporter permease subunit [[Mycoplasma] gypis]|uniref:ABC transporter permease subunit n=1 Tax=[Mycoplasma] gypis TaxID=92404 RepID=A0ABZ2RMR2_9BACT|nr:ABC transporter permease subunit [[Mycoplasma] gypis]MBN0919557.1 ABC transporter permease subunit [[Mycoplasma] gypis]
MLETQKHSFSFVKENKNKISVLTKKTNSFKRFFSNWIGVTLMIIWLLLIIFSLISFFWTTQPYKNLHNINLDQNVVPWFSNSHNSQIKILINPNDIIYKKILLGLNSEPKIHYEIVRDSLVPQIQFNILEYIQKFSNGNIALLGTDSSGKDVLVNTLQLFFYSVGSSIVLFTLEMLFGLFFGTWLASKQNNLTNFFIKLSGSFITIPDIIYILVVLVSFGSLWSVIVMIFVTGFVRLSYWAHTYAADEYKKDYILALKSINVSSFRIIIRHVIPAIFGRILILFARRIGYIIFLIATISFLGYNIDWNLVSLFKENWPDRSKNIFQILFPTLYLFVFLVINQFLAIEIAKVIDFY